MRISKFLQNIPFLSLSGLFLLSSMGGVFLTKNDAAVLTPPANDDCATATLIASFPSTISGTTVGATDSHVDGGPTVDCHPLPAPSGGVWFELIGTGGTISATTCAIGTTFDTRLSVYSSGATPGDCNDLTCVTSNDDILCATGIGRSKIEWPTTANTTYYVYLDGFAITTGAYELFVEETIPAVPLELVRFEGRVKEELNVVSWETLSESNTEWHIIERSIEGRGEWEELGRIEAAGFSNRLLNYEMEDADAAAVTYYRLRTNNYDRSYDYSSVIRVEREDAGFQLQRLAPMPFEDLLEVQFESDRNGEAALSIYDFAGKEVFKQRQDAEDGANQLYLDLNWMKAGIYLLVLEQGERRINKRIVKQKN